MSAFYDSNGKSYVLTQQIGRGGEGTVFACPDDKTLVAKIYHEQIEPEKAEKLLWMAENKNERLLKVAAWIVDTLRDEPDGEIVGFLMPNVKAKEIHELYGLKSRRVYFPDATWQFLTHTAANLARAFYNLHKSEHIMGDVNHGNCVVLADGTVKLIDCDSYSIKKGESRYVCEVGVGTHLAPELQGKNLREIERLEKHDNFGLAVIIFQLLFLGRHPFAGIYLGEEDKSIEDCIRELRFAYGGDAKLRRVKQPPGTLALAQVSPRIALMFERAFLTEDRPTAQEWIEALEDLSNNLKQCVSHPGHHYFQDLSACPWCGIEAQTGLMLFPFVSGKRAPGEESFNIFTVENLIANLNVPQNRSILMPPKQTLQPAPSLEAKAVQKDIRSRLMVVAAAQFFITFLFVLIFGSFVVFIPSVIIFAICFGIFHNFDKNRRIDLEIKYDTAEREWKRLSEDWEKSYTAAELKENLTDIRNKIDAYQGLPNQSRKRIKFLMDEMFRQRLEKYLNSFPVTDAQVSGVGEKKLLVLRSFGVKTAADLEVSRLNSLPGIGKVMAKNLIEWRHNLERNFPQQSDIKISPEEHHKIETEIADLRGRFEREINAMLIPLHSKSMQLRQRQQQLSAKSSEIAQKLAQTKIDFESLALKVPAALTMGAIAVSMIFFGNFVHYSSNGSKTMGYGSSSAPYYDSKVKNNVRAEPFYGTGTSGDSTNDYSDKYNVPENLTDEQIEAMTDWERRSAAKTLEKEATALIYEKNDYKKGEKKFRLALRLLKDDAAILERFAVMLHDQKKYQESLDFLKQAAKINPANSAMQMYIGLNYLKLGNYADARQTFVVITTNSPSGKAYYNLGLAQKGLKDYHGAVSSFQHALRDYFPHSLRDNFVDVELNFELGVALNKIGNKAEARKQYEILLKMNETKAAELKRIVDGK